MSHTLEYQSRSPAKPPPLPERDEYMLLYERERGRWLRRRFLWFVGIGITLAIPGLVLTLVEVDGGSQAIEIDDLFMKISQSMLLVFNVVAFFYAFRSKPQYDRLLRLAVVLYLFGAMWLILFARGYLSPVMEAGAHMGLVEGLNTRVKSNESAGQPVLRFSAEPNVASADQPTAGPADADSESSVPAAAGAAAPSARANRAVTQKQLTQVEIAVRIVTWVLLAFLLFLNHLFTCLFIPWTVRDVWRPSALVAALAIFVIVFDVILLQFHYAALIGAGVCAMLTVVGFLPGTGVCWWRYSRFNRHFRMQFESSRYRQIQQDLEGARRIHEAALPQPLRDGPVRVEYVYEPMRQIGGDLLYVRNGNGRHDLLDVIVLDVTGHGVAAALTANRLIGEIDRTYAERADVSIETLLRNLNRYVCLTLSHHAVFVTAIVMRVDRNTGKMIYANAGHPPAVLVRADGTCERLEPTSMLLGAADDDCFDAEFVTLDVRAGDAVIAYTDGASEAANDADQMITVAGVEQLVHAAARNNRDPTHWPAAILDGVVRHRAGYAQDDTLVVATWLT